jgi:carboxymethylenebutenolidase
MTETIQIRAGVNAAIAAPAGSATGGVVVIHEWHGLNDSVRAIVDRLAADGFLALAPDLYHGEVTTDDSRAASLMQALKTSAALDDVAACVQLLHARGCAKVGVIGFCMGGAMAFAAATTVDAVTCAVPFYGIPVADYWDAARMRVPIQAHFARHDDWAKPERAEQLAREVTQRGGHMELFVYDAGHAFMRSTDPKVFNAAAAATAWTRMLEFLRSHLV